MDDSAQPAAGDDLTIWFAEQPLSTRARNRLLAGVQGEDGQLRDLDRAGFLAELQKPRGGRVGEIPGLGKAVLDEVKHVFLADGGASSPATNGVGDEDAVAAALATFEGSGSDAATAVAEPSPPDGVDAPALTLPPSGPQDAPGGPRRRARPHRATLPPPEPADGPAAPELDAPAAEGYEAAAADVAPPIARARRGPRRRAAVSEASPTPVAAPGPVSEATAPPAPAMALPDAALATAPANGEHDLALERLMAIWPRLHRQGKAAVVVYAADIAIATE